MTTLPEVTHLSGPGLRQVMKAAMAWLEHNKESVNAINVFPVPDGDTGTNMYLTMRSTIEEADRCSDDSAAEMMKAMSHGALMGARGNSGVILSQIFRGFAKALDGVDAVDSRAVAAALEGGAAEAYSAVTKPVEGTILTVAREVAEAAKATAGDTANLAALMEVVVEAGRESVARTPTLLPVLAEAGVVDAGGQGLFVLLEGILRDLRGEETAPEAVAAGGEVGAEWLNVIEQRHQVEESPYGYCTEVLVEGRELDVAAVRAQVETLGDSVLVVGDDELVRVHVHTDDPGAVLTLGTAVGALTQVKVDNISHQAQRFAELHAGAAGPDLPATPLAGDVSFVAVAPGEGLAEVFKSVGCTEVVSGGPTMNPSTREILDAIEACASPDVVMLPNDKNIIMAAQQAAEVSDKRVRVVPSRSIPQGLAALLAVNPEEGLDEMTEAMEAALSLVRTIEITKAVRSTSINGVKVQAGETIAVVDDKLELASATPEEATEAALRGLVGTGSSLISLYYGGGTTQEQADSLGERLREAFPGHDVEIVFGGQPHYQYIVSLE